MFLILIGVSLYAQKKPFKLYGDVRIENGNLDGVTITLMKNNEKIKTVSPNVLGHYEFELRYQNEYKIIFSKPDYVVKSMIVNTEIPEELLTKDFKYKWETIVRLFPQYDGIDFMVYNQPVQRIAYDKKADKMDYDTDYSKTINSRLQKIDEQVNEKIEEEKKALAEAAKEAERAKKEEEERLAQEEKDRQIAEQEALKQAKEEEKEKKAEEQRLKKEAEEQAKQKAEEAMKNAQAEAEAKKKADAEARKLAEQAAEAEKKKQQADAEAKRIADAEARNKADQERIAEEARVKAEAEAKRQADRLAAEKEILASNEEKRKQAEEERIAREKANQEAQAKAIAYAEEQKRKKAEEAAKREEQRKIAEAKAVAEAERRKKEMEIVKEEARENAMIGRSMSDLAKQYPEGKTVEIWKEPSKTIKRVIMRTGDDAILYQKVKFDWGGEFYFRGTFNISPTVFQLETGEY